jgi:hypothetical protein
LDPKERKSTGEWRKMYSEKLQILCPSPFNTIVVNSGRMRRAEHATSRGENTIRFSLEISKS